MKKYIALLLFAALCQAAFPSPTNEARSAATFETRAYTKADLIKSIFNKALAREDVGALENAIYAYNAVLLNADKILSSGLTDKETAELIFPYYIAAAYRKGIVTNRFIEGSVTELYRQIKLYADADKWIQQVLTTASNYSLEKGLPLPGSALGLLYFAKAYNRAGWSFALLNGSLWKRYVIYPPADTVRMVEKCMDDLKKMASFYGPSYEPEGDLEWSTLSLCYSYSDKKDVKRMLEKQVRLNALKTIELFNSPQIQAALQKGRNIFTFEDLLKPETKEVAGAISRLLAEMEVK